MLWLLSSVPKVAIVERFNHNYLKVPWKSKTIMYSYMKLCSIFNCYFLFQAEEKNRFVLNRVGADLQVFMSGSNNRGTADIKDIMATGKRSQVAR